jgi:glycosyltransferase involved in cell wall biosynthesis
MPNHVFTAIIDTYYRPSLLKEAVNALFRQTYDNLEIILVNNGATPETIEYLYEVEAKDKRIKLVHFAKNQYSFDDPNNNIRVCFNAGLRAATGDYIWYQADDDLVADDYAEKMVALFKENPDCITAAGFPVSIDIHGKVIDGEVRTKNIRPRYMEGHLMALDALEGGKMFSAPGTIFTIKRDVLIKAGGYHVSVEDSQLYGIVPFGVTGFDETAIFYWRRHEGQLNKMLAVNGKVFIKDKLALLRDWQIEKRWQVFGKEAAREVVSTLRKKAFTGPATWFYINLSFFRFRASFRIVRQMWKYPYFWFLVSILPFKNPGMVIVQPLKRMLKPIVRSIFKYIPGLASISPRFARLFNQVNR